MVVVCSVCLVLPSLYGFYDVDAKEPIEHGANTSEWDSWLSQVPRGAYADSPVATGLIGLPELYALLHCPCASPTVSAPNSSLTRVPARDRTNLRVPHIYEEHYRKLKISYSRAF